MALKVGITRFLGTNCDQDIKKWMDIKGYQSDYLWYSDRFNPSDYDAVIIPGGFSHGDYLRCGALAAKTPVMKSVSEFAAKGKPVMGICNGFQILCEAKLLPGVLLQNKNLKFIDHHVELQFENQDQFFTKQIERKQSIRLPIAHGEGQFYAPADDLKKIQDNSQVWLTYKNNPNGSLMDIAGVMNAAKNVCGLMPHPERALFSWMGSTDGDLFLC
jgi:phosphoribosylformylglycinamidine synthase subunit PurQ / glutaminase